MSIPPRPQHRALPMLGLYCLIGLFISIALLVTLKTASFAKTLPNPVLLTSILLSAIPTWVGYLIDEHLSTKNVSLLLEDLGLIPCEPRELDQQFRKAAQDMLPVGLTTDSIDTAFAGLIDQREVIICEHTVGSGRSKKRLVSCAIWSNYDWPRTYVRERPLFERLRSNKDYGVYLLSKSREIISQNIRIMGPILSPLIDWLFVKEPRTFSFQWQDTPGIKEQWMFDGHWIILADHGRANQDTIEQLPAFLMVFIEQLEAQLPIE